MMKRLVILGSTGSIGTQALDIVRRLPDRFQIVGLAANTNGRLLAEQANSLGVPCVSIGEESRIAELKAGLEGGGRNSRVLCGVEGMCEIATLPEADLVVVGGGGGGGGGRRPAARTAGEGR